MIFIKMEKIYIYTLSDPKTKHIRYIGQTNNPKIRYYKHIYDAKLNGKKNKRCSWVKSLLIENKRPVLDIIDIVDYGEWIFWEQYWICQFKVWGFDLVNSTDGGEGSYNRNVSDLTKKRMSNAKRGKIPKNYEMFRQSTIGKNVIQYDLNGNLIKKWDYIQKAINETGIKNIKNVVDKKRCSAGGYIWRYSDDELTNDEIRKIKNKHEKLKSKVVIQYSIDNRIIKEWDSYTSVKKIYSHVGAVLRGKRKTAGGYKWKYK